MNMGDQNILGETQKNEALAEDNRQCVGLELPEAGKSSMLLLCSRPVMSDSLRPLDRSTPGLPAPHRLPRFAQSRPLHR